MSELTPGKRAEWRKDAVCVLGAPSHWPHEACTDARRILALLDALDKADKAGTSCHDEVLAAYRRIDELEARADKAAQERDNLAQAMWDAYVILGFDPDGDTSPAAWIAGARSHDGFARQWLAEVRQHRRDYDALLDESS